MKFIQHLKTVKLNKTAVAVVLVFLFCEIVYLSYRTGVTTGKNLVEQKCMDRANELCEARKSEFKLNFCEMPPTL